MLGILGKRQYQQILHQCNPTRLISSLKVNVLVFGANVFFFLLEETLK